MSSLRQSPLPRPTQVLWALLLWLSGCAEYTHTTRILDGKTVEGRFIPEEAYAAYLRAAQHEARGEVGLALMEYQLVLDHDPGSVDAQTRLASLTCLESYVDALEAFEDATALDPSYGPLWQERSDCALRHRDLGTALTAAREALRVSPLEAESTRRLAQVLERSGRVEAAEQLWLAYKTRFPNAPPTVAAETRQPPPQKLNRAALGLCLAARPHTECIAWAKARGIAPLKLSRWLLALGYPHLAEPDLRRLQRADPRSADARVLLIALALAHNDPTALNTATAEPRPTAPPSPWAARWVVQVLTQYVDAPAALAWEKAYERFENEESGMDQPAPEPAPHPEPAEGSVPR